MTHFVQQIITLSEALGSHQRLSHWSVSKMVSTKSDLIDRLVKGGDVNTRTYETVMCRFAAIWPADLEWPADIPRPPVSKEKVA